MSRCGFESYLSQFQIVNTASNASQNKTRSKVINAQLHINIYNKAKLKFPSGVFNFQSIHWKQLHGRDLTQNATRHNNTYIKSRCIVRRRAINSLFIQSCSQSDVIWNPHINIYLHPSPGNWPVSFSTRFSTRFFHTQCCV
jgi:hypothetical protein